MQELEDTLRLPVAGYPPGHQKNLKRNGNTAGKVEGFPAEDRGEETDFFDFDTIPRSKVVLPILDDELEDTLRRIPAGSLDHLGWPTGHPCSHSSYVRLWF